MDHHRHQHRHHEHQHHEHQHHEHAQMDLQWVAPAATSSSAMDVDGVEAVAPPKGEIEALQRVQALWRDVESPHATAQRLNNAGGLLIDEGRYDEAIVPLMRALRIAERLHGDRHRPDRQSRGGGGGRCCTLDECLSATYGARSQQRLRRLRRPALQPLPRRRSISCCGGEDEEDRRSEEKRAAAAAGAPPHLDGGNGADGYERECEGGAYVCSRPIYVPDESIGDGHDMGTTLSLVIVFNIAVSYHMTALRTMDDADRRMARFRKAVDLYEVAYRLQLIEQDEGSAVHGDDDHAERVKSLRFIMILANNLGTIHLAVNNRSKHEKCMEHLMSAMMCVVDFRYPSDYVDMDGFLRNTSHLVLRSQCAQAA